MNNISGNRIAVGDIPIMVHESMDSVVESIFSQPGEGVTPGFGVAINSEKVMKARSDVDLMATLQSATFPFADGIGVVWALRNKGAAHAVRIPGCELWFALMKKAGELQHPVFLVGAKSEVLERVYEKLKSTLRVNVVGKQHGYFSELQLNDIIQRIKDSDARIVTVAMGSPRQELFINRCRQVHPDAFYVGVGGTYDVFSGYVKRAPAWMRNFNVEWLYRLLTNPIRLGRQITLLKYVWLVLLQKNR